MTEDNNKTAIEDDNKIVSEDNNKIVSEDNNKIVIEYNNIDDDNSNDSNNNGSNNDDYEIKQINNCFKMIDETKSFEEQINLLKGMDLSEYWHIKCDYDKELNLKIFMLKVAYLSEDFDEKSFRCLLMISKKVMIKSTNKNIVNL